MLSASSKNLALDHAPIVAGTASAGTSQANPRSSMIEHLVVVDDKTYMRVSEICITCTSPNELVVTAVLGHHRKPFGPREEVPVTKILAGQVLLGTILTLSVDALIPVQVSGG